MIEFVPLRTLRVLRVLGVKIKMITNLKFFVLVQ